MTNEFFGVTIAIVVHNDINASIQGGEKISIYHLVVIAIK